MSTQALVASRYLRTLRPSSDDFRLSSARTSGALADGDGQTLVYHSLFGRGRLASPAVLGALRRSRSGATPDELLADVSADTIAELQRLFYLVPSGFDEADLVDARLRERADRVDSGAFFGALQLILTNGCNFTCDYCFAYKFEGGVQERRTAGENLGHAGGQARNPGERAPRMSMGVDVAEAAIDNAIALRRQVGADELNISLFGGEPTLNRRLILHLLGKYGRGQGHGIAINWDITTNGSRLDDALIGALAANDVDTAVSIDYLDPVGGGYRARAESTAPWSTVRDNVMRLLEAGVPVHITSVLSDSTWDRWGEPLIDWLSEVGIPRLNVIVSFQGSFFHHHRPEDVARKLLQAFRYGRTKSVLLTGYWYQTFLMIVNDKRYEAQADFKTCPAIGRMLSIEPNGNVFSCKATNNKMGSVSAFGDIFRSEAYRGYAMRAYRNGPSCSGCELEGTCSGGSTGTIEEEYGDIEAVDPNYCQYMRMTVNELLRDFAASGASPG